MAQFSSKKGTKMFKTFWQNLWQISKKNTKISPDCTVYEYVSYTCVYSAIGKVVQVSSKVLLLTHTHMH